EAAMHNLIIEEWGFSEQEYEKLHVRSCNPHFVVCEDVTTNTSRQSCKNYILYRSCIHAKCISATILEEGGTIWPKRIDRAVIVLYKEPGTGAATAKKLRKQNHNVSFSVSWFDEVVKGRLLRFPSSPT